MYINSPHLPSRFIIRCTKLEQRCSGTLTSYHKIATLILHYFITLNEVPAEDRNEFYQFKSCVLFVINAYITDARGFYFCFGGTDFFTRCIFAEQLHMLLCGHLNVTLFLKGLCLYASF